MAFWDGMQSTRGEGPSYSRSYRDRRNEPSAPRRDEMYRQENSQRDQLDAARERIAYLEAQIDQMDGERRQMEQSYYGRRNNVDQMIMDFVATEDEMINTLRQQLEEMELRTQREMQQLQNNAQQLAHISASTAKIDEVQGEIAASSAKMDEIQVMIARLEQQSASLDEVGAQAAQSDQMKQEILDKIHSENVACYRNMKSLVEELREDMDELTLSEESMWEIRHSFKAWKFFSFFSLPVCVLLVIIILIAVGYIVI